MDKPFKATPKYLPTIKYCLKPFQPVLKSETLTVRAAIERILIIVSYENKIA